MWGGGRQREASEGETEEDERGSWREREVTETETRTQNSKLNYSKIEILGICLFLQFVLPSVHANTYTTTVRTLTTIMIIMKMTLMIHWLQC